MSAAEKLKALDKAWKTEGAEEAWQVYKTLMPALPQIVAVVEAAETYVRADKEYQRRIDTIDVREALTALERKLGEMV